MRDEMREPGGGAGGHDDDERDDDPELRAVLLLGREGERSGSGAWRRRARRGRRGRGGPRRRRRRRDARGGGGPRGGRAVVVVLERGEAPAGAAGADARLPVSLLADGDLVDPRPDVHE